MKRLQFSGNTDPGRRRQENQDACIVQSLWDDDKALLAVIDGVGGYAGGEKAATIARESIQQYMQIPRGDTLTMLREAVVFANNRIVEERKNEPQHSEMCCVLTVVVADAGAQQLYYVHIGDTRLYRFRQGQLQKLTRDHSLVGVQEDAGEISEREAMVHPQRNQILREAGSSLHRLDDEGFIDHGMEDFLPGDLLLLCSDGLTDMITQKQMRSVLLQHKPLPELTNELIDLANKMGGNDNITVVLAQFAGSSISPEPPVLPEATTKTAATKKFSANTTSNKKRGLALLALLVIASLGWYFLPAAKYTDIAPYSGDTAQLYNTVTTENKRAFPSVRATHPAAPARATKADTLCIAGTQNLETLVRYMDSTGRTLVLMPAGNNNRFAAVAITHLSASPGDTLLIRNLRLKGFETGINVHIPVIVKTENLVFENILYPFNYPYRQDKHNSPAAFANTLNQ